MADLENAGAVQRVVGHSSQEEQKMVATLEQNCAQKNMKGEVGFEQKKKNLYVEICHAQNKVDEQG